MAIAQSKRTHCPRGHEYTPENTYRSGGRRICRTCNLALQARRRNTQPKPSMDEIFVSLIEVDVTSGCWVWVGSTARHGYAVHGKPPKLMHRWAYERYVGKIPKGFVIDHVRDRGCIHLNCVNPEHMEPVTIGENVLRGDSLPAKNKRKTHCPKGHPYDEANTYRTKQGWRYCRACNRERAARRGGGAQSSR